MIAMKFKSQCLFGFLFFRRPKNSQSYFPSQIRKRNLCLGSHEDREPDRKRLPLEIKTENF